LEGAAKKVNDAIINSCTKKLKDRQAKVVFRFSEETKKDGSVVVWKTWEEVDPEEGLKFYKLESTQKEKAAAEITVAVHNQPPNRYR